MTRNKQDYMNKKIQNIDLTQGVIWKQLLFFFLPILVGSLFQQLYITIDAIIVGQCAGKAALASIDSVYSLLKLPVNFLVGLSTGATIIISQMYGAKKNRELSEVTHTAIAISFVGGAFFSILGIIAAPFLLRWMQVPENIFSMTLSYVRIYYGGFIFSMLYNMGAGILRAVGNSQTPLRILMISSTSNLLFDLLFVGLLRWSVSGAALATVISQMLSAFLTIRSLSKSSGACQLFLSKIRLNFSELKTMIRLGLPVGLQSSLYPIANMLIQASINSTGTDYIAAWALCGKLDFLIWLAVDSLASAISTFVAQNSGAQQYTRVKNGVRTGLWMTLCTIGLISVILFFWCEPLGKLFINTEDYDVIPLMGELMRFLSPLYFIYVFGEVLSGAIRGAGETFIPMVLTLIGTCALRVLWILFIVPQNHTIEMIIGSYPVSWALTSCFFIIYYQIFKSKHLISVEL